MKLCSNLSLSRHYVKLKITNIPATSRSFALPFHEKNLREFNTEIFWTSFIGTDIAGAAGSPKESATAAPNSPCSPSETSTATTAAPNEQQEQQTQHQSYQHQTYQQQHTVGSIATAASHVAEDSGAPCEMRRTPPQNKGKFLPF